MKNLKFSRLFAAAFVVACLAFTGCKPEADNPPAEEFVPESLRTLTETDGIVGTWISIFGEKFEITASQFKNYYGSSECYVGDNLYLYELSEDSGIIYFKYTKALCPTHTDYVNDVYVYDSDAPDAGKWYAVYYSDLNGDTVNISGASGKESSCATLEKAVNEFTVQNGYFSWYSGCYKE